MQSRVTPHPSPIHLLGLHWVSCKLNHGSVQVEHLPCVYGPKPVPQRSKQNQNDKENRLINLDLSFALIASVKLVCKLSHKPFALRTQMLCRKHIYKQILISYSSGHKDPCLQVCFSVFFYFYLHLNKGGKLYKKYKYEISG